MAGPKKPTIEVRESRVAGLGVFALVDFAKGDRIAEYVGERISHEEADRRYDDEAMEKHHTWLFTVDDQTCIDAGVGGGDSRYINHSCAPNCEAVQEGSRIFIDALAPVARGTELFYDYRYETAGLSTSDARRLYPCHCGATSCRGTIALIHAPVRAARKKRPAPKSAPKNAPTKKSAPKTKRTTNAATKTKRSAGNVHVRVEYAFM
jgi:SET domain-containing protein